MCADMSKYCDCCGKWVWPSGEPEDWKETSHHRADAGPCIIEWWYFGFASAMFQTSNTSLSMYSFCNLNSCNNSLFGPYMCCIMRQCFGADKSYGSWLGLTIHAQGWDITEGSF
jgi:hypothetical protein